MNFLHKSYKCDLCDSKLDTYDDLIKHAREVHHHPIVKCLECGKEFIHEKDRLHHAREEHEKKVRAREEKNLHRHDESKTKDMTPQEEVDVQTRKFSDNFE
jgi:uncharacterized Zn finger protein